MLGEHFVVVLEPPLDADTAAHLLEGPSSLRAMECLVQQFHLRTSKSSPPVGLHLAHRALSQVVLAPLDEGVGRPGSLVARDGVLAVVAPAALRHQARNFTGEVVGRVPDRSATK